jgi:hypothetical protein
VACPTCRDIQEADGVPPPCECDAGCPIPPLSAEESRVMRMRGLLVRLNGLVEGAAVLGACGATMEDLELLASVEEEIQRASASGEA